MFNAVYYLLFKKLWKIFNPKDTLKNNSEKACFKEQ